jgi:hypothetical protein
MGTIRADIDLFEVCDTYPSLASDVLELPRCSFSDALRAPQFQTDPGVCECHGSNRQKVRQYHEDDVVPESESTCKIRRDQRRAIRV